MDEVRVFSELCINQYQEKKEWENICRRIKEDFDDYVQSFQDELLEIELETKKGILFINAEINGQPFSINTRNMKECDVEKVVRETVKALLIITTIMTVSEDLHKEAIDDLKTKTTAVLSESLNKEMHEKMDILSYTMDKKLELDKSIVEMVEKILKAGFLGDIGDLTVSLGLDIETFGIKLAGISSSMSHVEIDFEYDEQPIIWASGEQGDSWKAIVLDKIVEAFQDRLAQDSNMALAEGMVLSDGAAKGKKRHGPKL